MPVLDPRKKFSTLIQKVYLGCNFFIKIATLKGAKFIKTLPLWVQNALFGPTLKGAKSKKTDPLRGSIRGDQMYGSTPPPRVSNSVDQVLTKLHT